MSSKKAKSTESGTSLPVAITDRPSYLAVPEGGARGSENVQVMDCVIPRLELIQDLSPQRKQNKPEYIEGAEEGDIFNTVTRTLLGKSVIVVPVLFRKEYIIWKDRKQGGGFKGAHADEASAKAALAALEDKQACEIIDTAQHFCLLIHGGRVDEVVVSMSRTKMKVSRQWNSLVRLTGFDRFAHAYRLESVPESNAKGSFYNWKITPYGYAPEAVFRAGEKLYEQVKQGRVIEADRSDLGSADNEAAPANPREY